MEVLRESWCFCNGVGKSERTKAAIFSSKGPSMSRIGSGGTGFLIHRNLLLTTHANLPSVAAAEAAEIRLQNGVSASLFPHRFFITSSVLDLSIVGLDTNDCEATSLLQTHHLKNCSKPNIDLGSLVYLLGYTENGELTVGEGKVVVATDNLIKLSTTGVTCTPGSAGFDVHGNLAFIICDPMKLATSPTTKSSSTSSSSSSWKKDLPMQFGVPIPIICDWLKQHWEGNLDELSKPKLPIIRLMSSGQKSEHSCASFTMRQVFKEPNNVETQSLSSIEHVEPSSVITNNAEPEPPLSRNLPSTLPLPLLLPLPLPLPDVTESAKLTSIPPRKKETTQIHLLDINFPPRASKHFASPQHAIKLTPNLDQNYRKELASEQETLQDRSTIRGGQLGLIQDAEIITTCSIDGGHSEVESSSSAIQIPNTQLEYSSEGETTMYSAETAESRNYPSPKEGKFQPVGRSHSCVSYNRWGGPVQKCPVTRRTVFEKQRSFMQPRKVHSQGATSQRSNDYFSPTVASIMKKRNNLEQQPNRSRQTAIYSSPRWI